MDIINSPTIDVKMERLRRDIQPYQIRPNLHTLNNSIKLNLYNIYIIVPVITFFCLLILRPSALNVITIDQEGVENERMDIKNFIIWVLLISIVINVVIYVYRYKKNDNI